jgi:TP901 family phage tail tape measure protein
MTAIGVAIAAPIGLAMRQFAQFDDAIRATAAVSGASGAALQKLNDRARDLGATTSFTAVQVANLMTELGRAGFKPDEINDMTAAVLDLARATGTDAALSAGIMAATLRQFGMGATEATRAADVLTKTANSTFNTVESLGESLKYAGPVAKSLGLSLEDTAAILGVLGNVGIQGSEAGTALRRLSVISAGAGKELQDLFGVTNTDAAGNLKPLVDILDEINEATKNMPVAERTAKMAKAFGLLGITSANVLSQSADGVRDLADSLRDAEGTAAKAAKEMDAGLGGALRIALSAVEGTALAVGDALAPGLQSLLKGVENIATGLTKFVKENEALVVSAAKGVAIFTASGVALLGLGLAVQAASFAAGGLITTVAVLNAVFVTLPAAIISASLSLLKYITSAVSAGLASAASAATTAASWATTALAGIATFVGSSAAQFAAYLGRCAYMVAGTVASAATVAAAWLGPAAAAVATFVVGAASGFAAYVGACAVVVASSVASAAAVAAAWLAPLAPFALLAVAIGGAAALAYSFGGQIKGALAGVGEMAGAAGSAIGSAFGSVIGDAITVFGDLASTATTTFNGIYEAIADGDLAGAMDVLWAGLKAGWLRGVEALMSYVDPWISTFQNAFTILGAEIYKAWDSIWVGVSNSFNTFGAYLQGAFDNVINGVMAAWDNLEAGIRKSWNYVQSFFRKGFDLKKENEKVDNEMDARRRERELDRPGVEGRTEQARRENDQANKDLEDRKKAVDENTQATVDQREAENRRRADERRAATQSAEADVRGKASGKREQRVRNDQFTRLLKDIEGASSMDALRGMYEEFDALSSTGRLTSTQTAALETALEDAQERISKSTSSMGGSPGEKIRSGAGAAGGDAATSTAEVAGTFSSMALGGLGFGSSLAQKQLDALKAIEENTRPGDDGVVAA